jgi:hypothetical protein
MNVPHTVIFSDMMKGVELPKEMRPFMDQLAARLDLAMQEIVSAMRSEPTLYPVDPTSDKVSGAKPGDVAIYKDDTGTVITHVF